MQVFPIPNLEVMGTWLEARELLARQGWLDPTGLVGLPGMNFDSSPREVGGTGLCRMPLSLGPTSAFDFYLLFSFMPMLRHILFAYTLAHTLAFYLPREVQVLGGLDILPVLTEWWLPH